MKPISMQVLTGTASPTGLTLPGGTLSAWLQVITQNINYTLDGSTPSSASGLLMRTTDPPAEIDLGHGLDNFNWVGSGAVLTAIFFG